MELSVIGSSRKDGRGTLVCNRDVAGELYLINGVTGFFSIIYVPGKLVVDENATATAHNILASEMLFRVGIVSELICAAECLLLVTALYRLLNDVDRMHASLMVILAVAAVPIMFLNALNEIAALARSSTARITCRCSRNSGWTPWPCCSSICMARDSLSPGFSGGLWLFTFGVLVMRSGFLPRILGVLLIAACFAYLAWSFTALLLPRYAEAVNRFAGPLEGLGELSTMAWLLIKGAKVQRLAAAPAS